MAIDENSARSTKAQPATAGDQPSAPSFEDALSRLEVVVHSLEDGQIGLAEGLACYEEGIKLLRQCYGLLENAERRIELLSRVSVSGEATTEPFDESSQTLEEKTAQRSRRRTRKADPAAKTAPDVAADSAGDVPGREQPGSLF